MSQSPHALFVIACPGCRATIAADRSLVGGPAQCPLCADRFRVPDPGPERPARAQQQADPQATSDAASLSPAVAAAHTAAQGPTAATASVAAPRPDERATVHPAGARPTEGLEPAEAPAGLRRRASARERARRRSRRTLVIMLGGITILLVLAAVLGRRPRR